MNYQTPIDILQTQEGSTQLDGIPTSCRGCNRNLNSNTPATQYQIQKIIQHTVRVQSSLYTMNLASLSGYQRPLYTSQYVQQNYTPYYVPRNTYWCQMSDRAKPAHQKSIATGSTYHSSSTKHTITRNRPGAMAPGSNGVDIKHNSYNRFLNKLKGKGPIRRGIIPPFYGKPIPFNNAFPIYGGKIIKTGIINGCDCYGTGTGTQQNNDKNIYSSLLNAIQAQIYAVGYTFNVGDFVWAKKTNEKNLYKAKIINIENGIYSIQFTDDTNLIINTTKENIYIYFDCNCHNVLSIKDELLLSQYNHKNFLTYFQTNTNIYCNLLNILTETEII
jgi:hypothetical protein